MTDTNRTNHWPKLILLLLCAFLCFSSWSAMQAAGLGSSVTDSDYYGKGLKYNATLVEKRAATVLGWQLSSTLSGRSLVLRLTDRSGGVVDKATGSLYLAVPGAAENIRLPLHEAIAGSYGVELDPALSGAIQARLELERDGARLHRLLLLNL